MYPRLKEFRESQGLTQEEFGRSIGLAKSTYNNYELGIRDPKSDFWIAIATKYNVTIDYLMGFSDSPTPPVQISEEQLDNELITRLCSLTPEELQKVDAFVQGILAAH